MQETNSSTDDEDEVGNDEVLYRGVKHGSERVKWIDGELRATPDAFLDPSYEVSVDRAKKRAFDASLSQVEITDYICCLATREVRAIETVTRNNSSGTPISAFAVEVKADPLPNIFPPNLAHALILANPRLFAPKDRKIFRRLKAALAQIATWEPNFAPTEPN